MTTSSEDILLAVSNVRHKKNDGTLYLMERRIAWMSKGKDTFQISTKYSDIKMQKISPEGKAKIQLQLVLNTNDSPITFQFVDSQGLEKQLADRESVKQLLQQLLPRHRMKISRELEEKQNILQKDPDLFNLYKDLVTSGVLTSDEFWTQLAPIRCPQLIKILNLPPPPLSDNPSLATATSSVINSSSSSASTSTSSGQSVGIPGAFLADIEPKVDGDKGGIKYNITTEVLEAIFRTYPAVKRKHLEYVPHKLSESEFWLRFFQSHYFHRDRLLTGASSSIKGDLFADCAKLDEQDIRNAVRRGVKDPFVDINYFDDVDYIRKLDVDPKDGKKDSPDVSTHSANQALIKRYNLHSIRILESCRRRDQPSTSSFAARTSTDGNDLNASSSSKSSQPNNVKNDGQVPSANGVVKKHKEKKTEKPLDSIGEDIDPEELKRLKKVRLQEKIELEDLDADAVLDPIERCIKESKTLSISDKRRYLEGPAPVIDPNTSGYSHFNNTSARYALPNNRSSMLELVRYQENVLTNWRLDLRNCLSSPAAITALSELSPGGAFLKSYHTVCLKETIPAEVQSQLEQLYFSCNELLKHFWHCFPAANPLLEDKLTKMKSHLERFQLNKIQPFHEMLVREHYDTELTSHLLQQLNLAYTKFNAWQMRKDQKTRK
ncbi:transcription factor B1 [Brevipalpus obovatus]|uniref:transcription factor B1 n=1 Tax=Brevipalpus obovatus TaxID=246614 RepID=UPI003D9EE897